MNSPRRRRASSRARATSPSRSRPTKDISSSPLMDEVDPAVAFFYRPHTILILCLFTCAMLYYALFAAEGAQQGLLDQTVRFGTYHYIDNAKIGFGAALGVFVLIISMLLREAPFIRPHPVFWRAVHALSIAYQIFLVWLLFQNKQDARRLAWFIDNNLGVPLPERSYAADCSLNWTAITSQLDIFVLAHVLGWYGKALIYRDYWLCWFLSVLFEVMEYSLQHQLPNFAECWWDHWILDTLLCNGIGIYLGIKTCEYFAVKTYEWRGVSQIATMRGKVKRTIAQFSPHSWTNFEWAAVSSPKRFAAVLFLVVVSMMAELNAFYLKSLLWIPPSHPFVIYRLILVGFICIPGVREYYQYIADPSSQRLGAYAWLTISIILTESIICVKFGRGEFPTPAPLSVLVFWSIVLTTLAAWTIWRFLLRDKQYKTLLSRLHSA